MNSNQPLTDKIHLAIFASGAGTNAANCIQYFKQHPQIAIVLIITNKPEAGVIAVAKAAQIDYAIIKKAQWQQSDEVLQLLQQYAVDYILLAGYLALIPNWLIAQYKHRIFNIHPALLPDFGGKGMYGSNVHQAVFEQGATESGITIHEVDEVYDNGKICFQEKVLLRQPATPETIEQDVRALEYAHLPKVVERLLLNN